MTCQDESFNKDLKKLHYCVFVELFLSVKAAFLPCGDVTLAGSSQLSAPEFHTKVGKKMAKTRSCTSAAAATPPPPQEPSPPHGSGSGSGSGSRLESGLGSGSGWGSASGSGLGSRWALVSSCRAELHQAD